jgi:hypothetical protein
LDSKAAIEFVVYGGVIPAVAALVVFGAICWTWPQDAARRYASSLALAAGVFVGFVALQANKTLVPTQFWEWLPYLGLMAAFVAGLTRAAGIFRGERWLALYLFAMLAGWLTVPHWPELYPAWPMQVALFGVSIVFVAMLLERLSARLPAGATPFWLTVAAAASSLLMMAEVSVTFAQLALLPAGALAGCAIASLLKTDADIWRGLALPYATLVGGYAYVAAIYPTSPLWPLAAVPLAPVALWLVALGPLARLGGWKAWLAQAVCVIVPLALVTAMLLFGGAGGDDW